MQLTRVLNVLGRNDFRLIGRDQFLTGLFGYVIAMALVLRFGFPWAEGMVAGNPDIDLDIVSFYPLLIGYMVFFSSGLIGGMIVGFLILDERDQNTIKAMLVTPLPVNYYMVYRVLIPMALTFFIAIFMFLVINQALIPIWQLLLVAAVASLNGPLIAMFVAAMAQNKVQGFGMLKIIGTSGLLIFVGWFIAEPLQFLVGIFPPYWAVKAYWTMLEGGAAWPIFLAMGVVLNVAAIWFLSRRVERMAYA